MNASPRQASSCLCSASAPKQTLAGMLRCIPPSYNLNLLLASVGCSSPALSRKIFNLTRKSGCCNCESLPKLLFWHWNPCRSVEVPLSTHICHCPPNLCPGGDVSRLESSLSVCRPFISLNPFADQTLRYYSQNPPLGPIILPTRFLSGFALISL